MKPIKNSELKVGDWISTKPIFRVIIKNKLSSVRKVARVVRIDKNKIAIKCWRIVAEKVRKELIEKGEKIFLLDKDESMEIKKKLILNGLKNE